MAPAEDPVPPEQNMAPAEDPVPPEQIVEHPPPATPAESVKAAKRAKEQAKAQAGAEKLLLAKLTDCVPPSGDVRAHALNRLFLDCSLWIW